MGMNIARIVMASPQARTPEASFARYEQTSRLLMQYWHFPPDHPRAVEAIERTNYIHSRFPAIFEKYRDDMIYVWGQYGPFGNQRIARRIGARRMFTPEECQAQWLLQRETLKLMGCTAPERYEDADRFCEKFEETTMVETQSSLRFAETLFLYFENIKPAGLGRGIAKAFCEGIFPEPMKRASGLSNPSFGTKLGAWLIFDAILPAVDFYLYWFAFSDVPHTHPGEMGEDGLVERPRIFGREAASARWEDKGERFRIADVNDKYQPGEKLAFPTSG
ncbi:hypothetical protein DFJ74DRAFT_650306 [Hyaloraphidium curvatum]|nr:hypothetical protein DFJ74DRAFT_650306 [Hyaloraphidium curvatum]